MAVQSLSNPRYNASWLSRQNQSFRENFLRSLTEIEAQELFYDWSFWARQNQLPPDSAWRVWLILAGRGWGKTRTGAEAVRFKVESGQWKRIALVNDTAADVRDVMIEGDSGLMAISRPSFRPKYVPARRQVTWPNGATAICYSAEAPELLRGPQHDGAWADELAKWRNLKVRDAEGGTAWDNLLMGLRVGDNPQAIVSTTPRPLPLLRNLVKSELTFVTRGTSYENRPNLSPIWYKEVIAPYEGTRLGRQEIHAQLLEDSEGALWKREVIDSLRVASYPDLSRIVVAIDPSVSGRDTSAECGILVCGIDYRDPPHAFVLDDKSLLASPAVWAQRSVTAYHEWRADRIIAEVNNGGEMVELTLRTIDRTIPYRAVHASRGKQTRAEPISGLYEQGRVHHVGSFPELEDQLCMWEPGEDSPDRLDALVWALTELCLSKNREGFGF